MDNSKDAFHISFFKPTTEQALWNRNMVIWLVSVWAVAIFGFQIALYLLEEPTPEESYLKFESAWPAVKSGNASQADLQALSYASLSVLGKMFIQPEHKAALNKTLSWSVMQLSDSAQKSIVIEKIKHFENLATQISDIQDEDYLQTKAELSELVSPILGLEKTDVRTKLLPLELISSVDDLTAQELEKVEEAMNVYLIHNQSVLTDTKFLGFPFHYFYTAVFLLILFVGLCWLYCVRTDKLNTRLKIAD